MSFLAQQGDAYWAKRRHLEAQRELQRLRAAEAQRLRAEDREHESDPKAQRPKPRQQTAAAAKKAAERRKKAQALEPAPAQGEKCQLVLRFPCGRRSERAFPAHAALSAVYDWADCAGELAAPGNAFEVPETKFLLATSFPREQLLNRSQTLSQLNLCPAAVLTVCPQ
ncbi:unnamed protein product [Effrenium voratum]|nr:unnamed protein product [Effrenium voratum]